MSNTVQADRRRTYVQSVVQNMSLHHLLPASLYEMVHCDDARFNGLNMQRQGLLP